MKRLKFSSFILVALVSFGITSYICIQEDVMNQTSNLLLSDVEAMASGESGLLDYFADLLGYQPKPKKESWKVLEDYVEAYEQGESVLTEVSASTEAGAKASVINLAFQGVVNATFKSRGVYTVSYYNKTNASHHSFNVTHLDDTSGKYKTEPQGIPDHRFQTGGTTDCSRNYEIERQRGCDPQS